MKKILDSHEQNSVVIIDTCVNDCIAYWNASVPELITYQYADLTDCPKCKETRYVLNDSGKLVARKVFYYFPLKFYFRSLFKMKELVPLLWNDLDVSNFPSGSIRRSRGWNTKVH